MASANQAAQTEEKDSISAFDKLRREFERKEKGYKGQIGKLQAELAATKAKSGSEESSASQNEPHEAAKEHLARDYEKVCVDCGGDNPNFKGPPNVFCGSKGCDGRIPMGHVELADVKKLEGGRVEFPGVKPCFNCGKDDNAKLVLE